MPLFEGHRDHGLQRLFIEMPDAAKNRVAWKWPDQAIDEALPESASTSTTRRCSPTSARLSACSAPAGTRSTRGSAGNGGLVNHLTGDAYDDAEVYFVATRDIPGVDFGGPVDNLVDQPSGLVVSVRVFGELAYRVADPPLLLEKFIGTGADGDFDGQIAAWGKEQALAAIRVVVPDVVAEHGALAMGQIQAATADAALVRVNNALSPYGVAVTRFAELNVNLPDADAEQLKEFASTKADSGVFSGSFDAAIRGQAALQIAHGVATGNVGAEPGIVAGMMMGVPVAPGVSAAAAPVPTSAAPQASTDPAAPSSTVAVPTPTAHFCAQCGGALTQAGRFCPNCGAPVQG